MLPNYINKHYPKLLIWLKSLKQKLLSFNSLFKNWTNRYLRLNMKRKSWLRLMLWDLKRSKLWRQGKTRQSCFKKTRRQTGSLNWVHPSTNSKWTWKIAGINMNFNASRVTCWKTRIMVRSTSLMKRYPVCKSKWFCRRKSLTLFTKPWMGKSNPCQMKTLLKPLIMSVYWLSASRKKRLKLKSWN